MNAESNLTILGLGSNLGDRLSYLHAAINALSHHINITHQSSIIETVALLPDNAPIEWNKPYYNMVIAGISHLSPELLLDACQSLEQQFGREEHHAFWSPRTLDIDILAMGNLVMSTPRLTLPHPHLHHRFFVLKPLAEILPNWLYPAQGSYFQQTAQIMLDRLHHQC